MGFQEIVFPCFPILSWSGFHVLRLGMNVQSSSEYVKTILSCILGKQCFILRNKKERIQPQYFHCLFNAKQGTRHYLFSHI